MPPTPPKSPHHPNIPQPFPTQHRPHTAISVKAHPCLLPLSAAPAASPHTASTDLITKPTPNVLVMEVCLRCQQEAFASTKNVGRCSLPGRRPHRLNSQSLSSPTLKAQDDGTTLLEFLEILRELQRGTGSQDVSLRAIHVYAMHLYLCMYTYTYTAYTYIISICVCVTSDLIPHQHLCVV